MVPQTKRYRRNRIGAAHCCDECGSASIKLLASVEAFSPVSIAPPMAMVITGIAINTDTHATYPSTKKQSSAGASRYETVWALTLRSRQFLIRTWFELIKDAPTGTHATAGVHRGFTR
jgi:hypothetical protein